MGIISIYKHIERYKIYFVDNNLLRKLDLSFYNDNFVKLNNQIRTFMLCLESY